MTTFFVLLFLGAAAYVNPLNQPTYRSKPVGIIGGQDADIADYPYQVSILFDGGHGCGGSIISTTKILTAAHCFTEGPINNVSVRVGSSSSTGGGQIINIKKINNHPKWNDITVENDIAVVELDSSLTYGIGIQPVQLPDNSSVIVDGQNSTITGWGVTDDGNGFADILQVINVPALTSTSCQDEYYGNSVTSTMICAGEIGKDSCVGDSGGPLVINGIQQGVVSWGDVCGGKKPGVYTKVSDYLDFIYSF